MSLFSIIIPCYNCEKYVGRCFTSLQKQSYNNWEAIFVNDGSTDTTYDLLNRLSLADHRVKVYSQQNQGAAIARKYGLQKISLQSDYVIFLDVDDTLELDTLEKCNDIIMKESPDIIVSGYNIIENNNVVKRRVVDFAVKDSVEYLKGVLTGKYGWELCAKVYKKSLFDTDIKTPSNIRIGEDAIVFIQLVVKSLKICGICEPFYNYIQESSSASHVKSKEYAEETIDAALFLEDILREKIKSAEFRPYISAMSLLFYLNSIFKFYLGKSHKKVQYLYRKHLTLQALLLLPRLKAACLILVYLTNGIFIKYLRKYHG